MILFILEDQYTPKILKEITSIDNTFKIPIKSNIKNPTEYLNIMNQIKEDYIVLLDNYFPWKGYPEPLWNLFLQELLKTWKDYKIICISDRGQRLLDDYDNWKKAHQKWWILWWCVNKDGGEIYQTIKELL